MQQFFISLLEIAPTQKDAPFVDRLSYGGQMLLIGLLIVFAVLTLLWLSLELFNIISQRLLNKEASPAAPKAAPAPKVKAEAPRATDDLELIAVLTAAIAASEAAPATRFRVVSFKRK